MERLSDEFKGSLGFSSQDEDDFVGAIRKAIPIEFGFVHMIVSEYSTAPRDEKKRLFADLWEALNKIAPQGCRFGIRSALDGSIGFWEEDEEE